jgi:hypothetical protein
MSLIISFVLVQKGEPMRLIDADRLIGELHGTYLYDDNARQVIYRKIETQPTIEDRKEDKYKIGYADGYHKAESYYYARTAPDRDNAFKMGIEVGRGERKTGRWILVSERFPEEGEEVLVYLFDGKSPYLAWIQDGLWRTEEFVIDVDDEPIAWMPLPEPYREDGEVK